MVARRSTPHTIEITELDSDLAEELRTIARGDEPVQLTDAGRPLAEITPLRPADSPAPFAGTSPADTERSDEEPAFESEAQHEWDEAWVARRAMTEPYVFDPVENERVLERRNRLRAEFARLGSTEMSAVEMIREQRRHSWDT